MKLEFLSAGSPQCPLLRLFDFSPAEACELRRIFTELASGARSKFDLREIAQPVNDCALILSVGKRDEGILQTAENHFECVLTRGAWDNAAFLTEPFCASDTDGFQWLTDYGGICSGISLLLSPSGGW